METMTLRGDIVDLETGEIPFSSGQEMSIEDLELVLHEYPTAWDQIELV